MPSFPTIHQSVQATTNASSWTNLGGGIFQTTISVTAINPALGNTLVVEACLSTLDATLSTDITGYTLAFSDGITFDDPSGGGGTFTTTGNVNNLWLLFAAFIDPAFAPPGNVTATLNITSTGIPASPILLTMVCSEYSNLKDSFGRIGLQDIVAGANTGSSLTVTDGYGGTQPGDNFYVSLGVAVNQTANVTANSPFVTQKSATGLPSTSSSVYADYYNTLGESVTLAATGSSGNYGLGGTIGAFDIVCACNLTASETTFAPGDAVTLSWTSNPYTLTVSIDNGIGSVAVSGSTIVHPVADITYTLSVTGPNGSTDTSSVTLTTAPPTCNLTITGIAASGLPTWKPNTSYQQANVGTYQAIIIDPNGNYQGITTGGGGISGTSIPPVWGSTAGATTVDNTCTWTCVVPLDASLNALPYTVAVVRLGTPLGLAWTSTLGATASLSGGVGSVALNGSGTFTPGISQLGSTVIHLGVPSVFPTVLTINGAAEYTLSVTGPGGTTTSSVFFLLYDPVVNSPIQCFAPVNLANGSSNGGAAGQLPAVNPSFPFWQANKLYNQGVQITDSNGFGQVSLNVGTSAATPPTWAGIGSVTTETGGLQWQNTGKIYPAFVTQTGFGPLWLGGTSQVGFGFEDMVTPNFITVPPVYTENTSYTQGQIISILVATSVFSATGLQLLECLGAGTSGPSAPGSIIGLPYQTAGIVFSDDVLNPGGTAIWKSLGSLAITLNWVGSTIPAPDGYPAPGSPSGSGSIPQIFDGTVQTFTLDSASLVTNFITTPAGQDASIDFPNSVGIPTPGIPFSCPTWVSIGLGTGYINNPTCALGATVNVAGAWTDFFFPVTELPNGSITVVKATVPTGSPQVFTFTPSYGPAFTLTDGQNNNSGPLAPGTYSVAEAPVAGWLTTTSQDPTAIVVGDGQDITITFTNTTIPGSITVIKQTFPAGATDIFTFTPSWGAPFSLTDGNTFNSGPLAPGTYSITETPNSNWRIVPSSDPTAIVVTAGNTTTITFSNYRIGGGILALDENMTTDNGLAIVSRYVTYAWANAQDREQQQITQGRVIFPYLLADMEGSGQWNLTVWPETLGTNTKPNPYPFTQAPFTLANPALDDTNCPLNVTGNRAFIQIDSDGVAGTVWSLKRLDLGIADDPRMRVSGRNV